MVSTQISTEQIHVTTDFYATATKTITHQLPARTTTRVSTDRITYTSYASGSAPATVTVVSTSISTHVEQVHVTTYLYSTATKTITHQLPARTTTKISTNEITLTSYASGSAPATVTMYRTTTSTERVISTERIELTSDMYSTKTITHQLPPHTTTKVSTARITLTSYESGSAPATITFYSTEVSTYDITRVMHSTTTELSTGE